jgi:hypothetical protein
MVSLHIIRSEDYDWIGLYDDEGRLLHEGHSIQEEDLLTLLGRVYGHTVWSQEQFEENGGRCPSHLPDDIEGKL